jgi:hypothetical protein
VATASRAARATAGEVSEGRLASSATASWSARSRMTAIAAILSASGESPEPRTIAARASSIAFLILEFVSLAIAASRAGRALASCDLKTACAASRRLPGSRSSRVSAPIAASIVRRNRVLIRTVSRSAGISPASRRPVTASSRRSDGSLMKTFLSAP